PPRAWPRPPPPAARSTAASATRGVRLVVGERRRAEPGLARGIEHVVERLEHDALASRAPRAAAVVQDENVPRRQSAGQAPCDPRRIRGDGVEAAPRPRGQAETGAREDF